MYFEGANALKHGEIIFVIIVFDIVEWRIDITNFSHGESQTRHP